MARNQGRERACPLSIYFDEGLQLETSVIHFTIFVNHIFYISRNGHATWEVHFVHDKVQGPSHTDIVRPFREILRHIREIFRSIREIFRPIREIFRPIREIFRRKEKTTYDLAWGQLYKSLVNFNYS